MVEIKRSNRYVENIYLIYNIWDLTRTKKKTESQRGSGGPPENTCGLHAIEKGKKKRGKSLDATRLAEIRFQIYNK
jgi:hypothetical protein